jgi:hypothetical protein
VSPVGPINSVRHAGSDSANQFAALSLVEPENHDSRLDRHKSEPVAAEAACSPGPERHRTYVIDDTLGNAIDFQRISRVCPFSAVLEEHKLTINVLQEMEDLLRTNGKIWAGAVGSRMSVAAASLISGIIFEQGRDLVRQLELLCETSSFETLLSKCRDFSKCGNLLLRGNDQLEVSNPTGLLLSLLGCVQSMQALKDNGPSVDNEETTLSYSHLIIRKGTEMTEKDDQALQVLLQNTFSHLRHRHSNDCNFRIHCKVSTAVRSFFVGEDASGICAAFGLRLLLSSCKSYYYANGSGPAPYECRLDALKVAQSVTTDIARVLDDATMPCRCPDTLARHLSDLQQNLEAFVGARCFDLYTQAPWTAGTKILDMLDATFYYGLRLLHYRNYVGSALHVYNALQKTTSMLRIPILDHLSTTFESVIFPGGRPIHAFQACYARYKGGRLRFNSKGKAHRNGCHSMTIPHHTVRATAGFGPRAETKDSRLDNERLSLLYDLKRKDCRVDERTWKRVRAAEVRQAGAEDDTNMVSECCHHKRSQSPGCTSRLELLHKMVMEDLEGDLPAAKTNLCKVYLSCVEVVRVISEQTHHDLERGGYYCLCFVDAILMDADRSQACKTERRLADHKSLVLSCRDALASIFGEAELVEYTLQCL